jgi:hypothetical protein
MRRRAGCALRHEATALLKSGLTGRWDRIRTGNLRFWSTRRSVQTRPMLSNLPLNWRFFATHRPGASKHVQPVCSQFCSQDHLQARRINQMALFRFDLLKWQVSSTSPVRGESALLWPLDSSLTGYTIVSSGPST